MKRTLESLVDYLDSDDETTDASPAVKKRKLPALSTSLVPTTRVDNPSLHQGRVRSQPHVDGQFAAFVFASVKLEPGSPLRQLVSEAYRTAKEFKEMVPSLQEIAGLSIARGRDTGDSNETCSLHVSLTRPIYLRAHQRDELKRSLRDIADQHNPFNASFATFSELTNDERTRSFLALEIGGGHSEFSELCNAITPVLKIIRQQAFYAEPRFHASFAWALLSSEGQTGSDVDSGVKDQFPSIPKFPPGLVQTLNGAFKERLASLTATTFLVEKIYVKIGKETTSFRLHGNKLN